MSERSRDPRNFNQEQLPLGVQADAESDQMKQVYAHDVALPSPLVPFIASNVKEIEEENSTKLVPGTDHSVEDCSPVPAPLVAPVATSLLEHDSVLQGDWVVESTDSDQHATTLVIYDPAVEQLPLLGSQVACVEMLPNDDKQEVVADIEENVMPVIIKTGFIEGDLDMMNEDLCINKAPVKTEPCDIVFPSIKEEIKEEFAGKIILPLSTWTSPAHDSQLVCKAVGWDLLLQDDAQYKDLLDASELVSHVKKEDGELEYRCKDMMQMETKLEHEEFYETEMELENSYETMLELEGSDEIISDKIKNAIKSKEIKRNFTQLGGKRRGARLKQATVNADIRHIDTKEVADKVQAALKKHNIPQAAFAQHVLGRSQGTLSDLLHNPKPWGLLRSGRATFLRMWQWLQQPESVQARCCSQSPVPPQCARKVAKRSRFVFSHLQRHALQAIYRETNRPSKQLQSIIAEKLGLDFARVNNFFMNARRRSRDWLQ